MSERPLTHLPSRLGSMLDDEVDEERVHELWRGTRSRMARADRARAAARGGAIVAAVAACAIGLFTFGGQPDETAAPLRLATGGLPIAREIGEDARALRIALDEGSSVVLAPGTEWRPVANVPARFETELTRGRATFDVTPGQQRRWVVRAGATTVEVLGTRFDVSRDGPATRVRVERGIVRVIDARLEGGERILRAGESVVAGPTTAAEVAVVAEPAPAGPAGVISEEGMHAPGSTVARAVSAPARVAAQPLGEQNDAARGDESGWETLARSGEHAEAYDAIAERFADEAATASAERLLLLADVARLSGHPREAIAPLERLLSEHPGDPRAAIAAVVLGRIEMDALGRRDRARVALERALELGVPAALRPDVEHRLAVLRADAPAE